MLRAVQLHREGRFDEAEQSYRRLLRRYHDHPDILHLSGVLALDRGRPDDAIQRISRAVRRLPAFPEALVNLGNAFRAAGRPAEAAGSYRRAIALHPRSAVAHSNLGRLLGEIGDQAAALESCEAAIRLEPGLFEAHLNRALALGALGRTGESLQACREAVKLRPDNADALHALGLVLAQAGDLEAARFCQEQALVCRPDHPRTLVALALLLRRTADLPASVAACRRAIAIDPECAEAWIALGNNLRSLGQFEEAIASFHRALAIDPVAAEAYRGLATTGVSATPEMVDMLTSLVERPTLGATRRASLGFALGRFLDAQDRHDSAFRCLARANALVRAHEEQAGRRFEPASLRDAVDRIIKTALPDRQGRTEPSRRTERPIFVIGMPRSGTSLVEQVLASHSQIVGIGESDEIGRSAERLRAGSILEKGSSVPRAAEDLTNAYLDRLDRLSAGRAFVLDKMPDNVFELFTIARFFPHARVIFCKRDPLDTCLSCFFQRFSDGNQLFSYDLAHCGHRYLQQERLTSYWQRVLPLRTTEVSYEALVTDLPTESRRLLTFLDLPWERGCLDFHRTERAILTASSWQVRQPLHRASIGRWRAYREHLAPLIEILGDHTAICY